MAELVERREVDAPAHEVVRFLRDPEAWLEEAATAAGERGEVLTGRLRSRYARGPVHVTVSKRVKLTFGRVERVRDRFVVPVTWEATGFAGLFPVMDAIIEVHQRGPDASLIVFWGRYDPPLGRVGDLIDRSVAHDVATATVEAFVAALADRASASAIGG